jgi:uncharacterized protein YjiS (DUF1127 family)
MKTMSRSHATGSVYGAIRGLAGHATAAHRRRQDARALEALPDDIRADIGLPRLDSFGRQSRKPVF